MQSVPLKKLRAYVDDIKANPEKAWEIPIGNKVNKDNYYASASQVFLINELGIAKAAIQGRTSEARSYISLIALLNDVLIREGILLERTIASALELRRVTLVWWKSLSDDEKRNLDTFGNSIQFKKYIPSWRSGKNYEVVTELAAQLNNEMIKLGALRSDYLVVKERDKLLDKSFISNQTATADRWRYLESLPLETENDLVESFNSDEYFPQLKHLAASVLASYSSKSSKNNFRDAYNHLCKFLIQSDIDATSKLKDILNEFILVRFKQDYIISALEEEKLSPATAPTLLSSVRTILKRAKSIKGLDFNGCIDIELNVKGRVTDSYKPFEKQQRDLIKAAIERDIKEATALLEPYKKVGGGTYPLDNIGKVKPGFGTLANARYLFENHLNCKPVYFHSANSIDEKGFLKIVSKLDIGLHALYKSWGVLSVIDADFIAPFAFRLAQITGMNADSIFNLYIDTESESN